ncbi:uncharacterized protein LOC121236602 [Juglans microcarpa x Juglans regia]|uniref:uncharacterized protein LOC121236602 n=1 Tax=Juglans microcarpa x Juglans regia TaxID=2249226 RepID=UPI001B7EBF55|nr:uncharacterized protein LOC121236602 [Juglans microcarpa x Juglans regia]
MKGVMRFGKKGKLSPRFIGPFEILDRIGPLAYRVALPPVLAGVHNVFHVSMLRMYVPDLTRIIDYKPLQIQEDMTYAKEPVRILEKKEQVIRTRTFPLVKVLWNNHATNEASWELEEEMRDKHPCLSDGSFDNL